MKVEDLKNTKIYLSNEEDRIKFQEKVFKLGVTWTDCSQAITRSMSDDMFFIINKDLYMFIDWGEIFFIDKREKQIFLDDVLAIEEPKEECKFKPYDRVLVRSFISNDKWLPRLFADYHEQLRYGKYETTDGKRYNFCVSYEENKELANTTKNPEQ